MPLEKYREKRSADRTPEPFGRGGENRPHLFVVQKHAATRLHYDFRLEWGGVLKSWAVPHGPSPDPAEKRLAMEVEDHPVEYADFEGVIPEGNYGAGEVIVWDQGRWTPLADLDEGMKKGKLLFELHGYRMRGKWTLVRMKTKGKTTGKEWLLIKERDAWARKGAEAVYPQESILSGLTLEEMASGVRRAADIRDELARLKAPRKKVKPSSVGLMLAEPREKAFSKAGWIWELKYDGYRLLASREEGAARLFYRRGMDSTATFPEIARALAALPFDSFVLDGEVVVLDEKAKPSFSRLQQRALLQRRTDIARASVELPATLFAFDLLAFEDFDLRPLPLSQRKALLQRLVPKAGPVRYADHVETLGEELLAQAGAMGLEGVVGKKADASYRAGRSADWVKVRLDRTGDFAVVGWTKPEGSRTGFGALHLAYWKDGGLVYAGRVGTGFSERDIASIHARLEPLRRSTPVFSGAVPAGKGHAWVEPELVAEVRYKEFTRDGNLRHPAFLRLRDDKPIEDCTRDDVLPGDPTAEASAKAVAFAKAVDNPLEETVKTVPLSNLDKIFWPEEGYTKGDLIEYYRAISPWLLPYLKDRPIVMTRYPDGIHGKSFFQKDAPKFAPDWIRLERIWSEHAEREIDYFVCDDLETLLYVANLGSIPLHVWASRVASPERPDWCILDLDPKGAPFAHVLKVAQAIHTLCEEIALPHFLKTSGATGLHVLVPLGGQCTHAESKALGEILARIIEQRLPKISTTARMLGAREGKVYIDYLQNGHGKTIAAPFSARPVPGATCSAPLKWSEAGARLDPKKYTLKTLPARMKRLGEDPLAPVLKLKPDLHRALARLTERLKS